MEIRPALLDNVGARLELRLNDPMDSLVDRRAAANVPASAPGRGLTAAGLHFQAALPRVAGGMARGAPARGGVALAHRAPATWHWPATATEQPLPDRGQLH